MRLLLLALLGCAGLSPVAAQTTFAGGLAAPNGLLQLADGRVLVVEAIAGKVTAFDSNGSSPATFATTGTGTPAKIIQLADGRFLVSIVADTPERGSRVIAFDANGGNQSEFATDLSNAAGLTQLADGRVLVVESAGTATTGFRVTAFNADGSGETTFADGFTRPSGVTQLADGRVLVTNGTDIVAFASDGTGRTVFASGLDDAVGITQLSNGLVLVSEIDSGSLVTFNSDGTGRQTRAEGLDRPNGVAELADGRILVSEFVADGRVLEFAGLPVGPSTDLVVDTVADDQFYQFSSSREDCTDGFADGDCTLREAIEVANDSDGALVTIGFDVLDTFGAVDGVATISPLSALPAIVGTGIVLDGFTQPGASANTLAIGSDAVIRVELDGQNTIPRGLRLEGDGATVRGIAVYNFNGDGIEVVGADGAVIDGSHIGTDSDGAAGLGNSGSGVSVRDAADVLIGTDGGTNDADRRNVISGNARYGVLIGTESVGEGANTTDAVVAGNYIGVTPDGTAALANTFDGVFVNGAPGARIGTDNDNEGDDAEGNVISGNSLQGIAVQGDAATGAVIAGNLIGLDAAGTGAVGNGGQGVRIVGVPSARVGGTDAVEANQIASNGRDGVFVTGADASASVVGNLIGTNGTSDDLGNGANGVSILDASGVRVEGNIVGFNTGQGIEAQSSDDLEVADNFVGTNAAGDNLRNDENGVLVASTSDALIEGNAVGFNGRHGISTFQSGDLDIADNFIGTDDEDRAFGNSQNGVFLLLSNSTSVEGNTIGNNSERGVRILDSDGVTVTGNRIGTNANSTAQSNTLGGVLADNSETGITTNTVIGGLGDDDANVIVFNDGPGVAVAGSDTQDVAILGNQILDNDGLGIDLEGGDENDAGVTENDANDTDDGPNGLQNYPVLTSATTTRTEVDGGTQTETEIRFTLSSQSGEYRVEFFSGGLDPSGFGEGLNLIGSTTITVGEFGTVMGSVSTTAAVGDQISATATRLPDAEGDPIGGTSEFSRRITAAPSVQFASPASGQTTEGNSVSLEVTLSAPASEAVTVDVTFAQSEAGDATSADIGGFTSQQVTFNPGDVSETVTISVTEDGAAEDAESFRFLLSNSDGATIDDPSQFFLDVAASEQTVTLTFDATEVTVQEGETSTLAATLTTGDGAALGANTAFVIAQVDGTADNDDFAAVTAGGVTFDGDFPETITIPAGTPSGTVLQVPIPTEDDGVVEGDEIANLEVTSTTATVVDGDFEITIEDAPAVQFAQAAYVSEEGDTVEIVVTLSEAASGNESVEVVLTDGDSDDLDGFSSETITFADGDTEARVEIDVTDDGLSEDDEAFTFELQNLVGLGLGTPSETDLTVALSVATVSLEISFIDALEGDSVEVEVSLSDAAEGGESVTIVLDDTSGPDATAADVGGLESVTVTFADGEDSASFTVPVTRDGVAEEEETFTYAIEDAGGLEVGDEDETTITVAPSQTGVQFADAAFMVAEGATATLTLVLGGPAVGGETVEVALVATSDGADADDLDGFETQTVTFATGDTTAVVEIPVLEDGRTEDAESFTFEIQNATALEVGTPAQVVVTVDPSATTISFAEDEIVVNESVGSVEVEVEFGEPLAEAGQFDVVLARSSDDAPRDLAGAGGAGPEDLGGFESVTVEVDAGATSATVEIPVTDDAEAEGTERFEFEIRDASGGGPNGLALGNADFTLVINDNENPVAGEASEAEAAVGLAFPNPTAGTSWVEIVVDVPQRVRITVLDAVGREVSVRDLEVGGIERVEVGSGLAPGTYLVRVVGETVAGTRQLTVAR